MASLEACAANESDVERVVYLIKGGCKAASGKTMAVRAVAELAASLPSPGWIARWGANVKLKS